MNLFMASSSGNSRSFRVSEDTLSLLQSVFLKDPRVVDGAGEKIVIGKCKKTGLEKKMQFAEISVIEFENDIGETKTISLSGYSSYEMQYNIYHLTDE